MKYLVTINGKQFEVGVEVLEEGASQAATPVAAVIPSEPAVSAAPVSTPAAASAGIEESVLSPMPGNIWEVQVVVGQQVTAGQSLVILEAMKMENEIVAPRAGTVKQILVAKGAAVNTNDVLVVLN